jgi:hypothetical protein
MLDTFPSKIITQYAWAPIEAWTSAVASATEYAARAVSRRSSPLDIAQDLAKFARVATLREKPTGLTTIGRFGAGPSRDSSTFRRHHTRHQCPPSCSRRRPAMGRRLSTMGAGRAR